MGIDSCRLCPRACGADRTTGRGFCGASADLEVASVCLHRGEEPPLNPIVNIFFAHCNLQCIYCQNWQISKAESGEWKVESIESLTDRICATFSTSPAFSKALSTLEINKYSENFPLSTLTAPRFRFSSGSQCHIYNLNYQPAPVPPSPSQHPVPSLQGGDQGEGVLSTSPAFSKALSTLEINKYSENFPLSTPLLGFVTAAHYAHHIAAILDAVHQRGIHPTVVYNSGGYESVETLRSLEGLVDIYLPDFKYMDSSLAASYSHAPDYPEVATAALREMIRQVGSGLKVDDQGIAYRGLIVRHLVLPGHVDNSLAVLDHLADMVPLGLRLSLMAQYFPPRPGLPSPLDRPVTADEYAAVVAHAEELGLTDGWIQELTARDNYRPDFNNDNPFEN